MPANDSTNPTSASRDSDPLLVEVAWEVCQQLGGIYTVIRTKLASMVERWGRRYCLLGPYTPAAQVEFEPARLTGTFGQAVATLREYGVEAHYGRWLVIGRPAVVLLDPKSAHDRLGSIKHEIRQQHHVNLPDGDALLDDVLAFGSLVQQYLEVLAERQADRHRIVAHFHEWMGGAAIEPLRRRGARVATVFTTHATQLGRHLAIHDPAYYEHLPHVDAAGESRRLRLEPQAHIERTAAHSAHVFTTVSALTATECRHLLGRDPDVLLPNGLNIERFVALHEFQNLHRQYKEKIHDFVMGHFFPSYSFELDRTLYVFTSGRYEYRNKGYDLTLEALARLNRQMKAADIDRTVVAFFITRRPYRSINPEVLNNRAVMEELRHTCQAIQEQVGEKLFIATAMGRTPKLDDLVEEYWRLRLRRTVHAWRTERLPIVVTHDLADDGEDEILAHVRGLGLFNRPDDPVKIVYHPDFITPSSPLFGMDYDQFVRGCHLGVFPSYYEPWGYTPLECIARGVPAVTTDLSGFGSYVQETMPDHDEQGLYVLQRRGRTSEAAADDLADRMFQLVQRDRRQRIALRNRVESTADQFNWSKLITHYHDAHDLALERAE